MSILAVIPQLSIFSCSKSDVVTRFINLFVKEWFKPNIKNTCTRTIPTRFCEVAARTDRFKQSPISHLTTILNRG